MRRIVEVNEDCDRVWLKVEGRLAGDWVSEVDRACQFGLSQSRGVTLDLSGVTGLDQRGVETLKGMTGKPVRLVGAPPLVQALLGRHMLGKIRRSRPADGGGMGRCA